MEKLHDFLIDRFVELCETLSIDLDYASSEAKKRYNIPQTESFLTLSAGQLYPLVVSLENELAIETYKKQLQKTIEGMRLDPGWINEKEENTEINEHNRTIMEVLDVL